MVVRFAWVQCVLCAGLGVGNLVGRTLRVVWCGEVCGCVGVEKEVGGFEGQRM